MFSKKLLPLVCLVIVTSLILTACGSQEVEVTRVVTERETVVETVVETVTETVVVEGTAEVQEVTRVVEVEKEVVITATPEAEVKGGKIGFGQRQEPDNLDPHKTGWAESGIVMMNIYDSLVFMNPDTDEIEPWLAESWEISDDGTSWTFHLRPDVTFHDGTPFNAEVVKFNLDRAVAPETASPYSATALGTYESSEVIDEFTVTVNFTEPFAPFAGELSQSFLGMVSPTAVEKWGEDFGQHPVGTGPFIFKEWAAKDHITLVRNPDYNWAPEFYDHQGPAYLEEITWRFVSEHAARLTLLETGEVDLIILVPEEEVVSLATNPNYQVIKAGSPGISEVLWFNTEESPTDDLRLRQAIEHAIDREAVAAALTFNVAPIAYGPIAEATMCFDQSLKENYPYPFDLEKAKALLDEAGWVEGPDGIRVKDGQRLELSFNKQSTAGIYAEIVQGMLYEVGIDLRIEELAPGAYVETGQQGDFHISHMGWISKDPIVMEATYHSKSIGAWNWHRFRNDRLDQVIDESNITLDTEKRCELVEEAQQILMDNAVVVPLYDIVQTLGMRSKLHGVRLSAQVFYPLLYDAWLDE